MRENTRPPRTLRLATRGYYWKPSTAWFRALELQVYERTSVALSSPVLDLGCGDGRVADMLAELGVLPERPVGVELSARLLDEARRTGAHRALLRVDGAHLPFPDESFASVLCNGVLCSVADGPTAVLDEIARVLRPRGVVVATFPTDRFLESLLWTRVLRFSPQARDAYERRVDHRQQHVTSDSRSSWRRRFERAGLSVERQAPFLSRFGGGLWSVMAMQIFRPAGSLKLVPSMQRPVGTLLARLLLRPFERETAGEGEGYLLLMGRKPEDSIEP